MPENIIQEHQNTLVRWLEDRQQRNEETVTLAQFCDVLMNRTVSREDCEQVCGIRYNLLVVWALIFGQHIII